MPGFALVFATVGVGVLTFEEGRDRRAEPDKRTRIQLRGIDPPPTGKFGRLEARAAGRGGRVARQDLPHGKRP